MNSIKDHKREVYIMDSVKYYKHENGYKSGKNRKLSITEIVFGALFLWIILSEFVSGITK